MNWEILWERFLITLLYALPWIIVGVGGLSILSFSPLGRALVRRLQHGTEDPERASKILEEVKAARGELGEILERLDYTEQLLRRAQLAGSRHALPGASDDAEQAATPT